MIDLRTFKLIKYLKQVHVVYIFLIVSVVSSEFVHQLTRILAIRSRRFPSRTDPPALLKMQEIKTCY